MQKQSFNKVSYINIIKGFLEVGSVVSGIKIGLFELLSKDAIPSKEIQNQLKVKCKLRNFEDFLDKLSASSHLIRKTSEKNGEILYKSANQSLAKQNPHNLIPYYLMLDRFLKRMNRFDELIMKGEIKNFEDTFAAIYSNPNDLWAFLNSMSLMHEAQFEIIAKKFDFKPYKTMTDIGGALGSLSLKVKQLNPHMECTTMDLPTIQKHAEKFIEENGFKDQIQIISGDMFLDSYPKSDIIIMANLTNDWDEERKKILFKNAFEGLNENGVFLIVEEFINKKKEEDNYGLNLSLYMFVECTGGFNISLEEVETYAKNAGFKRVENATKLLETSAVLCYK